MNLQTCNKKVIYFIKGETLVFMQDETKPVCLFFFLVWREYGGQGINVYT